MSGIAGIEVGDLVPLLPRLKPLRGRMTTIDRGQGFEVIVDYAHTPSSFQTVFPPLRGRVKGRMICVFGSGGRARRREAATAGPHRRRLVRRRHPRRRGSAGRGPAWPFSRRSPPAAPSSKRDERLFLIPDRPAAIRKAFSLAQPGDLVALLGKGHENSIIYARGSIPYDEIGEAATALAELGYERKS